MDETVKFYAPECTYNVHDFIGTSRRHILRERNLIDKCFDLKNLN